jgi:hypothetical protein
MRSIAAEEEDGGMRQERAQILGGHTASLHFVVELRRVCPQLMMLVSALRRLGRERPIEVWKAAPVPFRESPKGPRMSLRSSPLMRA